MKTLYLDCSMGAAGDMLLSALLELIPAPDSFVTRLSYLGIPGVKVTREPSVKCGITGTHLSVTVEGVEETSEDVHHHGHAAGHSHGGHDGHGMGNHHGHGMGGRGECAMGGSVGGHDGHSMDNHHGHGADGRGECPAECAVRKPVFDHDSQKTGGMGDDQSGGPEGENTDKRDSNAALRLAAHISGYHDSRTIYDHDGHISPDHHCHVPPAADHGGHPAADHHDPSTADHDGHTHAHGSMAEVEELIGALPVSGWVRESALAVYRLIAEAEARVHGVPVAQVHFHEVGSMDAVMDIVGVCLLLEELAPQRIVASPVHVGSGQVRCAHGVLPVPAPATAQLLLGIPCYGGEIAGELCTPTGAALLRHFVTSFGPMPAMTASAVGYGMGSKDFPAANCLRAMLGEDGSGGGGEAEELCCNLDDMTGEDIGFACQRLLECGALDVFTIPVNMKKSRPGVLLVCLARPEDADRLAGELLRHTTTFGVRRSRCQRVILDRTVETVETEYGPIRVKTGKGYGVEKSKPEYEDLAAAARRGGISIQEVRENLSGRKC